MAQINFETNWNRESRPQPGLMLEVLAVEGLKFIGDMTRLKRAFLAV